MRGHLRHLRLFVLTALLAPLAVATGASASDTEIVVKGSRSAYADVVIKDTIYVHGSARLSGGDEFVGLLIEPLDVTTSGGPGQFPLLALRAKRLGPTSSGPVYPELAPGRYRFWFFADAEGQAVLSVSHGGFELSPQRRVTTRVTSGELTMSAGATSSQLRQQNVVPPTTHAIIAAVFTGSRLEQTYLCATSESRCPTPLDLGADVPTSNNGPYLGWVRPATNARDVLAGSEGLRTGSGGMTALVLNFAPRP